MYYWWAIFYWINGILTINEFYILSKWYFVMGLTLNRVMNFIEFVCFIGEKRSWGSWYLAVNISYFVHRRGGAVGVYLMLHIICASMNGLYIVKVSFLLAFSIHVCCSSHCAIICSNALAYHSHWNFKVKIFLSLESHC